MISSQQDKLNTAYNLFLFDLIIWNIFSKSVEANKEQECEKVGDRNKMLIYKDKVMKLLPDIDKLDRSKIRSSFLFIDDVALIQHFKERL